MQALEGGSVKPAEVKFESPFRPLLPVGFHRANLDQIRRLCVEYFPQSTSRPQLMETLTRIVDLLNEASFPATLWIEGAFVTLADNPASFDATLVCTQQIYDRLTKPQDDLFHWFGTASLADNYRCNNYAVIIDAERPDGAVMQEYWVRQYGFDRADDGHGVLELLVPSLAP